MIIKFNFRAVNIYGTLEAQKLPILIIANHISWWDGFWVAYLNMKHLGRNFYFMMQEDQLIKHLFFNYIGGFSINRKSRSTITSLNYASQLLSDCNNAVLIFPQGKIHSAQNRSLAFEKGVGRILKGKEGAFQILFVANMVDYFSHKKPTLNIYFSEYSKGYSIEQMECEYNAFYQRSIELQMHLID